jgi:rhodanese-related sulfurtransferase
MTDIDSQTLAQRLKSGDVVLIDVREPQEFAAERIPGAVLMPLSTFDPKAAAARGGGKTVVITCLAGGRAARAAGAMVAAGAAEPLLHRESLTGWKAAGLPTATGAAG